MNNRNFRFLPKSKAFPSKIPIEFQEPKEDKFNLIRQSQQGNSNLNEEFYNSDLANLKQVEIANGKESENDDVIINNQLHENVIDQSDSVRMKYLINANATENIDFINTLIRLKGRNNTQQSDRMSIENNYIPNKEDESKSYIREILDICGSNNNKNINSNLIEDGSFDISVNDTNRKTINKSNIGNEKGTNNKSKIKGINTKDLIEITNRRKLMKDSLTSVDPYMRRRHLEEIARMEKIKKDIDKKEFGANAFTPQINKRSKQICDKMTSGKYQTIDNSSNNNKCDNIRINLTNITNNNIKLDEYDNNTSLRNYTNNDIKVDEYDKDNKLNGKDIQQLLKEAKDIDNNDMFKHYLTTNKKTNNISNQIKYARYENYNSNGSNTQGYTNIAPIENLSNIINVSNSGIIPSNLYRNNQDDNNNEDDYQIENNDINDNIPIENRLFYSTEDLEREAQMQSQSQQSKKKIKLNLKKIKENAKIRQQILDQYQTVIDPNTNISITNSGTLPSKISSVNTLPNNQIEYTSNSNNINPIIFSTSPTDTNKDNNRGSLLYYPQGHIKLEINNKFIFPNAPNKQQQYDNASSTNDFVNYGSNNPAIVESNINNTKGMINKQTEHIEDLSSIIHLSPDMDKNEFQVQDMQIEDNNNKEKDNYSENSSINDLNQNEKEVHKYEDISDEGESQVNEYDIVTNQKQCESKEIKLSQLKGNTNVSTTHGNISSINLSKLTNFIDYNSNASSSGNNLSNQPSKKVFTPKSNYYNNLLQNTKQDNKTTITIPHPVTNSNNMNVISIKINDNTKTSDPISQIKEEKQIEPTQDNKDVKVAEINLFDDSDEGEENGEADKASNMNNKTTSTSEYERKINFFNDSESVKQKDRNSTIAHIVNSVEPIEESKIEIDIDDLVTPKYIFNNDNNIKDNETNITPTKSNMRKHISKSFCGTSNSNVPMTQPTKKQKRSFIEMTDKQRNKTKNNIKTSQHKKSNSITSNKQSNSKTKFKFEPKKQKNKTNNINTNINKVTININKKDNSKEKKSISNNVNYDNYFKNIFNQDKTKKKEEENEQINNTNANNKLSSLLHSSENIAESIINSNKEHNNKDNTNNNISNSERKKSEFNMDKFSIEVQKTSPTNKIPNDFITDSLRVQRESQEKSRKKINDNLDKIRKSQEKNEIEIKKEIKKLNLNETDFAQSQSSLALRLETEKELNKII